MREKLFALLACKKNRCYNIKTTEMSGLPTTCMSSLDKECNITFQVRGPPPKGFKRFSPIVERLETEGVGKKMKEMVNETTSLVTGESRPLPETPLE